MKVKLSRHIKIVKEVDIDFPGSLTAGKCAERFVGKCNIEIENMTFQACAAVIQLDGFSGETGLVEKTVQVVLTENFIGEQINEK